MTAIMQINFHAGFLRCSEYGNRTKSRCSWRHGRTGRDRKRTHYETGAHAGDIGIDLVCGIGELSKELVAGASEHGCEAKWFPAKADFLAEMKHLIQPGDNILVKASHGMQFPEIVDELQKF